MGEEYKKMERPTTRARREQKIADELIKLMYKNWSIGGKAGIVNILRFLTPPEMGLVVGELGDPDRAFLDEHGIWSDVATQLYGEARLEEYVATLAPVVPPGKKLNFYWLMLSVWAAQTMYHWDDWILGNPDTLIPTPDCATRYILFEREDGERIIKVAFRRYRINGIYSYAFTIRLFDAKSDDDLWIMIPRVLRRCDINRLWHQDNFWETEAFQNLDNEQNKKHGGEVSFVFMHYVKIFYALLTLPGMKLKGNTNWPLSEHSFDIKGSLYL